MMPQFAIIIAAGLTSFIIFILIVVGSAIFNWLQQKAEEKKNQDMPHPPRRNPGMPPRPVAQNWEEELKRVLQTTPRRASSPPIHTPPPPPLPVPRARASREDPELQPAPVPLFTFPDVSRSLMEVQEESEPVPQAPVLGRLSESAAAHSRASSLQEMIAARLQGVDSAVSDPLIAVPLVERNEEIVAFVNSLRSPATIRQAFLASLVFSPPKAFEAS
jgi:hypothetical protein